MRTRSTAQSPTWRSTLAAVRQLRRAATRHHSVDRQQAEVVACLARLRTTIDLVGDSSVVVVASLKAEAEMHSAHRQATHQAEVSSATQRTTQPLRANLLSHSATQRHRGAELVDCLAAQRQQVEACLAQSRMRTRHRPRAHQQEECSVVGEIQQPLLQVACLAVRLSNLLLHPQRQRHKHSASAVWVPRHQLPIHQLRMHQLQEARRAYLVVQHQQQQVD